MCPQEQSVKEDVFPDAEGWENVDPEEAAKWSVGSEFAHDPLEQNQTEGEPLADTTIRIGSNPTKCTLFLSYS